MSATGRRILRALLALALGGAAVAGCVTGSDACQSDQDCGRYLVCEGGFCVRGCDEHQDCERGFFCDEGHCRGRPPQDQAD